MKVTIRVTAHSRDVFLPQSLLTQIGLAAPSRAELVVEGETLVLRCVNKLVRAGWAQAAQTIAAQGEDELWMVKSRLAT